MAHVLYQVFHSHPKPLRELNALEYSCLCQVAKFHEQNFERNLTVMSAFFTVHCTKRTSIFSLAASDSKPCPSHTTVTTKPTSAPKNKYLIPPLRGSHEILISVLIIIKTVAVHVQAWHFCNLEAV